MSSTLTRPRRSRSTSATKKKKVLELDLGPTAGKFASAIAEGSAREIAAFGARGDGKTISALIGMVLHASKHEGMGFPLPVSWIGVADTFTSHKLKTIRSLNHPLWEGAWKLFDGEHKAIFLLNKAPLVTLDLFGIEDQGAMDRVRMETVGVWFEEPAPSAVLVQSSGISETAWLIALTSQRMPSHAHPAIITSNYPDEDHWTWQRFAERKAPGTLIFRIPPGERASKEQREEWSLALKDRPDLLRRLLAGEPGTVVMGPQVAQGFNPDVHVSKERLEPFVNEPMILGWDFGHTPCCVIGQEWRGFVRVNAAIPSEYSGTKQLITNHVRPWLAKYAPWSLEKDTLLLHEYDPSGKKGSEGNIDDTAIAWIRELLGGHPTEGRVHWQHRYDPLLAVMNRSVPPLAKPALIIDPVEGKPLIRALEGRWYFPQDRAGNVSRDLPKKPNHPWEDLGDAFCYFLGRLGSAQSARQRRRIPQPEPADSLIGY